MRKSQATPFLCGDFGLPFSRATLRGAVAGDDEDALEAEVLVDVVDELRQARRHGVHAAGVVAAQEAVPAAQQLLRDAALGVGADA